jgi:hypothetical protein
MKNVFPFSFVASEGILKSLQISSKTALHRIKLALGELSKTDAA